MKIAINTNLGAFRLSKEACEMLGCDEWSYAFIDDALQIKRRADKDLISVIEKLGINASYRFSCINIKEIPNEATDWIIFDYDGLETLYYVLDGKIIEV